MDNVKCKVQNERVALGDLFKIICEANTFIMHYALCIMHLTLGCCVV